MNAPTGIALFGYAFFSRAAIVYTIIARLFY